MKKVTTVTLEEEQIRDLDLLVDTDKYASRSHAVRIAVQGLLEKEKALSRGVK